MARSTQRRRWTGPRPSADASDSVGIIRDALHDRGETIASWSRRKGFRSSSVYSCLATWAHRRDRAPHGGRNAEIMAALALDLGTDVVRTPQRDAA